MVEILQQSSKDIGEQGWDAQTGFGAVDMGEVIAPLTTSKKLSDRTVTSNKFSDDTGQTIELDRAIARDSLRLQLCDRIR
jgi:hypothetical protein